MATRTRWLLIVFAILSLVAAGCGGDSATDNLVENILEQQPGVDEVDIDSEDDSMTISFESEEGDISMEMGSGQELPEGFPFPIPDGSEVVGSSTWEGPDGVAMQAGLEFSAENFDSVVEFYEDFFEDEGFEITKTTSGSGVDAMVMLLADRADTTASVVVTRTDLGCSAGLNWSTDTS